MRKKGLFESMVILATFAFSRAVPASDFDIIINEINYHPFTGNEDDEFVELYNCGPQPVDLKGWSFSEGIDFTFTRSMVIGPGEYLVVSPNENRAKILYKIQNVTGNYSGRLDNGGEIIALSNPQGKVISRFHYEDGGVWPSSPDGMGTTLEVVQPQVTNDLPQNWAASLVLDGTPGRQNSRFQEATEQDANIIIGAEDLFQTFKGTEEPSNPITEWTKPEFVASSWPVLQGPFGGVDEDYFFNTELDDMVGRYSTFYMRRTFDLDPEILAELQAGTKGVSINVKYDDGFVAYLNGIEVGREHLGTPGNPVPHDAFADETTEDLSKPIPINDSGLLKEKGNVLALQGANINLNGSDFLLSAEMFLFPTEANSEEIRRTVVINEIRPTQGAAANAGFIELFNAGPDPVDVSGYFLVDSRGARFEIPGPLNISPGSFLVFGEDQLGFPPDLAAARYALVEADGKTWIDGMNPSPGPAGASFGCYPDGNEDQFVMTVFTRRNPNQLSLETAVVINEILYHPVFVAPPVVISPEETCLRQCSDREQWIELHNQSGSEVDVSGWSLTKGVNFTIPENTKIPGNGYLVIASNRERFLELYPGFTGSVIGDWIRSLSHGADTINLRDELDNRVDHVRYGDGDPINDDDVDGPAGPEEADGINDLTILASTWPKEADDGTLGRSLELIHPRLDNRAGASWRAGPEASEGAGPAGGTPGKRNDSYDSTPAPVVWDVEHSPVVPKSTDRVQITCRVTSVNPVSRVDVLWHLDPDLSQETRTQLRDDGLSGDREPGDGIYGGTIPPQGDGQIVGFQIEARGQDAQIALIPWSPAVQPYGGFQGPFFLYQVDDRLPPANGSATYRIIMAEADHDELWRRISDDSQFGLIWSNMLLPCTFIGDGKAYHTIGVRIRGESTRDDARKGWRVNFPPENTFRGVEHVNLVAHNIETELLGADLFRRAGIPYMQEWPVNLIFQGDLDSQYIFKENFDNDFLQRYYGGSSGGNLYRAQDPDRGGARQGDLTYFGEEPEDLEDFRRVYDKKSNQENPDYSDIIELCKAFDPDETPDEEFPDRIRELIDVEEWARFFAVQDVIANRDGGIWSGTGEDYLLYRVPETSRRPDFGKWILIPWDIDESFEIGNVSRSIFRQSIPAIVRFLHHPDFVPFYYAHLLDLREGSFSRLEMRKRYFLIDRLFSPDTIDEIDSFIAGRSGFLDETIPTALGAGITGSFADALIQVGEEWKYFKGTEEPSNGNRSWATRNYNDTGPAWLTGETGIGYGDDDDATVLDDMQGNYTTLYARKKFNVPDPGLIESLWLSIDYDDGFVAYLNGQEVARSTNVPGGENSFVPYYETADPDHEAGSPESFDLSSFTGLLVPGDNALAIQVVNATRNSSDLSLIPELFAGGEPEGAGCGTILYATGSSATMAGSAPAGRTRSVEVNGKAADYVPLTAQWTATVSLVPGENTVTVEAFDLNGSSVEVLQVKVHRLLSPFTKVTGTLPGNTTWSAAEGPYRMTGDVTVPQGSRLTIEAGTFILGERGASIIVEGLLEARGTSEEPIFLRAASCQDRLGGIAFDNTGTGPGDPQHLLRFVDLEFGDIPDISGGFNGVVALEGSKVLIEDCTFRDLDEDAINGLDSRLEVRRSLFERIRDGIRATGSTVIVLESTFSGILGENDAIRLDVDGSERSRIERCLFEYSSDDAMELMETSADIRENIFRSISGRAISLESNGSLGPPVVTGNLIHDSGIGIALRNGVAVEEGDHNTVAGCLEGLDLFTAAGFPGGSHSEFHSMIVWNNIINVKLDFRSSASFNHSNIGGQLWPGSGNISSDPLFTGQLLDDYSLSPGSPSIATGKDGTDMGAIPYTGGVGIFKRGDADGNNALDLTDVYRSLEYLFLSRPAPSCLDRLDVNDDGFIDISDSIFLLFYLYGNGDEPPPPFASPGEDQTPDNLECR